MKRGKKKTTLAYLKELIRSSRTKQLKKAYYGVQKEQHEDKEKLVSFTFGL